MKFVLLGLSIMVLVSVADGQRRPPNSSTRSSQTNPEGSEAAARGLSQLRHLETKRTRVNDEDANPKIVDVYRRHSTQEAGPLAPSKNILDLHSEFLKQPGTGIVKLNSNEKCAQDSEVVTAEKSCEEYQLPGGGTSFSFRFSSYRIPRLSDLILKKNVLLTDGIAQQGVLVDLGDTQLEYLTLESKELQYLRNFKPATTKFEFDSASKELVAGIRHDDRLYRLAFFAKPDRTFALRSIAYQGSFIRRHKDVVYDEFKYDKRQDVIVVFRIVELEPNGSVTIVWKEFARKDAPKLPV